MWWRWREGNNQKNRSNYKYNLLDRAWLGAESRSRQVVSFPQHRGNQSKTRRSMCTVQGVKDVVAIKRAMGGKLWGGRWEEVSKICMPYRKEKGWSLCFLSAEVDCRGFPEQLLWKLLARLGISERACKTAIRRLGEATERLSRWICHPKKELS